MSDFLTWQLCSVSIAGILTLIGWVSARNLPPKFKRIRIQRFAAAGLAIVLFVFMSVRPHVSSYSIAESIDDLSPETATAPDKMAEHVRKQDELINRLKAESVRLRQDLDEMNDYYWSISNLLMAGLFGLCVGVMVGGDNILFKRDDVAEGMVEEYQIFGSNKDK